MGLDASFYLQWDKQPKEEKLYLRKCYTVRRWVAECFAKRGEWIEDEGDLDFYVDSVVPLSGKLTHSDIEYIISKCYEYLKDIDLNKLVKIDNHTNSEFSDWQILHTYMTLRRNQTDNDRAKWLYDDTG